MAAFPELLSRLYTISIVFLCLLLLETLILFRSVARSLKNPDQRVITTPQLLQLIEDRNPAIPFSGRQSAAECAVCLSEFEDGESVRKLKCEHTFHRDCLDLWLQEGRATCPLCRSKVLPDDVVSGYHRHRNPLHYDGSDEEMIFLLSLFNGNGLHRIF